MTTEDHSAILEAALAGTAGEPSESLPQHHARLMRAMSHRLSPADFAVLLRASAREAQSRASRNGLWVPTWRLKRFGQASLNRHSLEIIEREAQRVRVRARRWTPGWLSDASELEDRLYWPDSVRPDRRVPADPVLLRLGHDAYSSEAQREAIRTVLGAPAGATVVVLLPTGAGKTACGLLPASLPVETTDRFLDPDQIGVTPFVIPTTSLALDLERRASDSGIVTHATAWRPGSDESNLIQARIRSGNQGPVFASPEAIAGGLHQALCDAATSGFIRHIVIDEAHMLTAWGDEFRPAFQQLATVCRELRNASPHPITMVLMTATLTEHGLETLQDLFDSEASFQISHAVRLRPEPMFAWRRAPNRATRTEWLLDALAHLPRPAILYTTKREHAKQWHKQLRESVGYQRLGLIHGATPDHRRLDMLQKWRADEIDLMVATSAFGLGVDKPDVRAVLHSTFPESLDRYYQDVGRGGRDGHPSLALMVWTNRDKAIARDLSAPTFIGVERGIERWRAMFTSHDAESHGDDVFSLPTDVSPSTRAGDIDMQGAQNERWNLRTLLLLQRCRAISLVEKETRDVGTDSPRPFVRVQIRRHGHLQEQIWSDDVEPRRKRLLAAYHQGWQLMQEALTSKRCLAHSLQEQYTVSEPDIDVVRACGSCPSCRSRGRVLTVAAPTVGSIRARHTLVRGDAVRPPAEYLANALPPDGRGYIFVDPRDQSPDALLELAEWFVGNGLCDFLVTDDFADAWRSHFAEPGFPVVFFHGKRPRGIRRGCPIAVFLPRSVSLSAPVHGMLVLRADTRDPARPDRLLSDVVAGAAWTLSQFMDRYVA